ncbi:hypothetical protein B4900_12010 [Yersinia rohdei]|nr:hypothetical protein B4900_12010 [Yersinia rohdei]
MLIYKYWQPIQAFFSGFFTGLVEGLQPVKAAFAPLSPIFDAIGSAIGRVWDWFTQLLSPVESSKASLEAATNAGKTFGEVVGMVISGLFWPVEQLAKGLGWLLEKLGAIPKAADAASGAVAAMNGPKAPVMYEWDPVLKKWWKPNPPGRGALTSRSPETAAPWQTRQHHRLPMPPRRPRRFTVPLTAVKRKRAAEMASAAVRQ